MELVIQLPSGQTLDLSAGTTLTVEDLPFLSPQSGEQDVAQIVANPHDPSGVAIKNLSTVAWHSSARSGPRRQVDPGRTFILADGQQIDFGQGTAKVRAHRMAEETIDQSIDPPSTRSDDVISYERVAAIFGQAWQEFCNGEQHSPPAIADFLDRITPAGCKDRLVELPIHDSERRHGKHKLKSWTEFLSDIPQLSGFRDPTKSASESELNGERQQEEIEPIEIRLEAQTVLGRVAAPGITHLLEHPRVSRRHTLIEYVNGQASIRDLGSTNGTFVNGQRIVGPCPLPEGATIDIGPFRLSYSRGLIRTKSRFDNIELTAISLRRTAISRETNRPIVLLDDISLVVKPREFVCIIGGAGSGKSTLLKTLSCRAPVDSGQVLINGADLGQHFHALKSDMAVVQQKDLLLESLTIRQSLMYTASLRLTADMSKAERLERVDAIIEKMHLTAKRDTSIKYLSGGQIKRVSLANELLSDPSLIFLDEVTSGLDEATDRDMMILFREIADAGKTILCVTHSLAHVEETCTHVAVLAPGGILAFYGTPDEALSYFKVKRLGDIYSLVKKSPERTRDRFRSDDHYLRYVSNRLPKKTTEQTAVTPPKVKEATRRIGYGKQTLVLLRRYCRIQFADYSNLATIIGQSVVISILMILLFGKLAPKDDPKTIINSTRIMFMLSLSAFWFGCSNSAKEIVKERRFYERERDADLSPMAYLTSKWVLLGLVTIFQNMVLIWLVKTFTDFKGGLDWQMLTLCVSSITGMALGLFISAASETENQAQTTVPIILIPQVLFAGVIVPLSSSVLPLVKVFSTSYWNYAALFRTLGDDDIQFIKSRDLYVPEPSFSTCLWAMLLQAIIFAIGTRLFLAWRDRIRS